MTKDNPERLIGKRFGPEPYQYDPYEGMTDNEFETEVREAIEAARQHQKAISLRLPEELLERTKAEAKRRGLLYQTLIKVLLEKSLDRLDRAS